MTGGQGAPAGPDPAWLTHQTMIAAAHGADDALTMLEVVAHKPVQGEAMHKVIGYNALLGLHREGFAVVTAADHARLMALPPVPADPSPQADTMDA